MVRHITTCRRWLEEEQSPTLPYVVKMYDGRIGEALSPFYLCDLIFDPNYTDCDDPRTWFMIIGNYIRKVMAKTLEMEGYRILIYDARGKFYDSFYSNYQRNSRLPFLNKDNPIIIDIFNPYTTIVSLIKCGFIEIFEKYPTFSESKKIPGCKNCTFNQEIKGNPYCYAWDYIDAQFDWEKPCWWLTNGQLSKEYIFVNSDNAEISMGHRETYLPVKARMDVYLGFNFELDKMLSDRIKNRLLKD